MVAVTGHERKTWISVAARMSEYGITQAARDAQIQSGDPRPASTFRQKPVAGKPIYQSGGENEQRCQEE